MGIGLKLRKLNGNEKTSHHFSDQIYVHGWNTMWPQGLVVGQAWQYVAWGSLFRLGKNEYPRHLKDIFSLTLTNFKEKWSCCLCCRGGAQHAVPASEAPMAHRKETCIPCSRCQVATRWESSSADIESFDPAQFPRIVWCPQSFWGTMWKPHRNLVAYNIYWGIYHKIPDFREPPTIYKYIH